MLSAAALRDEHTTPAAASKRAELASPDDFSLMNVLSEGLKHAKHQRRAEQSQVPIGHEVAKVARPLMSIARICDRGHKVVFETTHATVLDSQGREVCRFARKGNLYMVDVTLKAPRFNPMDKAKSKSSGFTRPGR